MNRYPNNTRRRGFTLIELLVVIAIIMLLMGLSVAGINAMKDKANTKKAVAHQLSIINALNQYRAMYGRWPHQTTEAPTDTFGEDTQADIIADLTDNPREEILIEIPYGDLSDDGKYLDPWKRPYVIGIDQNGDNNVEIDATESETGATLTTNIPGKVAIMSWGSDPEKPGKHVYSWDR